MRNYYHDLGKYPPITVPGMLRGRVGLTVYSFGFRVRIFGASEVEYYGGGCQFVSDKLFGYVLL